jgi:hypothetical protein
MRLATLLSRTEARYNRLMNKGARVFLFSLLALTYGVALLAPVTPSAADSAVEDSIREEDRLGARSDQHSRVFDKAVSALVHADAATFRSMLSSTTVLQETRGPGAIDAVIQGAFIPFFAGFEELTDTISTAPTYDVRGNSGIAIARSFKTKSGEVKPFVIYLINEIREGKDVVVVGNLLINTTGDVLQKATAKRSSSSSVAVQSKK